MLEAMSDLDVRQDKIPRDKESLQEFLGGIKDSKFGLGGRSLTLLDVLSEYKDKQEKDDFDFFETYYESDAANKNLKRSNETLEIVYFNEDEDVEDEESLASKITFQTNETISQRVVELFRKRYEDSKEKDNEGQPADASIDQNKNNHNEPE